MPLGKNLMLPGIDTNAGLRCTGSDYALYISFLSQFPSDDSIEQLEAALRRGDAMEAFNYAHMLKGLCAQLGICQLADLSDEICQLLRDGSFRAIPAAQERFIVLRRRYAQVVRSIKKL